ncbi:hypothetical protein T484DRAFT_1907292, partial [Baffinella frigidus]
MHEKSGGGCQGMGARPRSPRCCRTGGQGGARRTLLALFILSLFPSWGPLCSAVEDPGARRAPAAGRGGGTPVRAFSAMLGRQFESDTALGVRGDGSASPLPISPRNPPSLPSAVRLSPRPMRVASESNLLFAGGAAGATEAASLVETASHPADPTLCGVGVQLSAPEDEGEDSQRVIIKAIDTDPLDTPPRPLDAPPYPELPTSPAQGLDEGGRVTGKPRVLPSVEGLTRDGRYDGSYDGSYGEEGATSYGGGGVASCGGEGLTAYAAAVDALSPLRVGEEVLSIDGVPAWQLGPACAQAMLYGKNGSTVVLHVWRGGAPVRVELTRRSALEHHRARHRALVPLPLLAAALSARRGHAYAPDARLRAALEAAFLEAPGLDGPEAPGLDGVDAAA